MVMDCDTVFYSGKNMFFTNCFIPNYLSKYKEGNDYMISRSYRLC